jgi:hypothetical protein
MYEKSKEKYAVEMQLYSSRTKPPGDDISAWGTISNCRKWRKQPPRWKPVETYLFEMSEDSAVSLLDTLPL